MNIACYARVSTEDQNLSRQVESTLSHAESLGADLPADRTIDDIIAFVEGDGTGTGTITHGDVVLYYDRSTGTDTQRAGYEALIENVGRDEHEAVVVHSVSRVSRSIRDLDRTAEHIVEDNEAQLHIISEGFELLPEKSDPFQRAMFQLLGVFAELEAELAKQRAREGIAAKQRDDDYRHGRAPLGFVKDGGAIREGPEYDHVCAVLEDVEIGEMSKRAAARELGTSRRTINRSLDERPDLYGLAGD